MLKTFQTRRAEWNRQCVRSKPKKPQREEDLKEIAAAALRVPASTTAPMGVNSNQPGGMDWRPALAKFDKPLFYLKTGWAKIHNIARVTSCFTDLGIPFPGRKAHFVAGLELEGGMLLALGLGSRLAALPPTTSMVVAYITAGREALVSVISHPDRASPRWMLGSRRSAGRGTAPRRRRSDRAGVRRAGSRWRSEGEPHAWGTSA